MPLLEAVNVPCGPIYDMKQVFEDPQVRHRGMQLSLAHGAGVQAPAVANPIRLSETPIRYGRSAPLLGEHNQEVLRDRLGFTDAQLQDLQAKGVI